VISWRVTNIRSRPDSGPDDSAIGRFTIWNDGNTTITVTAMTADEGVGGFAWSQWWPSAPFTVPVGGSVDVEFQAEKSAAQYPDPDFGSPGFSLNGMQFHITVNSDPPETFAWDDSSWVE
jgi:hypothetical protein